MRIAVTRLKAAGPEYTRLRRLRGMPPVKRRLHLLKGRTGPVIVECGGCEYTLYDGGAPCAAS